MGFQAAEAVVALDWDFRPYVEAHGTVKEPTQAKLDAYSRAMLGIFADMGLDLPATASDEDIQRAMADNIDGDRPISQVMPDIDAIMVKIRKTRIKAAAGVCSGSPTIEQITKLPPRVQEAFLGWVAGFASDPTLPQPATNPSRAISRNGVSAT